MSISTLTYIKTPLDERPEHQYVSNQQPEQQIQVPQDDTPRDQPPPYALIDEESLYREFSHSESQTHPQSPSESQSQHRIPSLPTYVAAEETLAPPTQQFGSFTSKIISLSSKAESSWNKAVKAVDVDGWWAPTSEKECQKTAKILESFTSGTTDIEPLSIGSNTKSKKKEKKSKTKGKGKAKETSMPQIPLEVLKGCAGLAIFNVYRTGAISASLSAGSGVVVSRLPDGSWSPPSAFTVSSVGVGLMIGLDVYDCVCVLNTPAQVTAFTSSRMSLGAESSVASGPASCVNMPLNKDMRPIWSYMKSRGAWAGVQLDGTVIVPRSEANATFFERKGITPQLILNGNEPWPTKGQTLLNVLEAIDSRANLTQLPVPSSLMSSPRSESSFQPPSPAPPIQEFYGPTSSRTEHSQDAHSVLDSKRPISPAEGLELAFSASGEQQQVQTDKPSDRTRTEFESAQEEKERLGRSGW